MEETVANLTGSASLPAATPQMFGTLDMVVFFSTTLIGAVIGVYFMYFAPKGDNEEADYLVGGRRMGVIPIALSLVASYLSGITLIGHPSEINVYGCQYMYKLPMFFFVGYLYIKQILPVFYGLNGLSLNEYFVKRFDRRLRILGSILFFINTMSWLPIVVFVPALVYEQVTGYNVHYVTPVVCLVCVFYTSIGGIKAVVWTDVIQMVSMFICVVMVTVKGTMDAGGFSAVWNKNVASGRIEPPNFDLDPTVRHTIYGLVLGGSLGILNSGFMNQSMVQRQQTLGSLSRAKKTVWLFVVMSFLTIFLSQYYGLVIAAYYAECDPVSIQLARTKDQVVPLFVMESIGHIPGLSGIYISGIFSAALSSLSTGLNTMSGVFVEDWIRGCTSWNPSDHQAAWIMKIFVVVMGVVTVALVIVVQKLGMIVQMALSISSMSTGPMLTLFLAGLFLPWVDATGALVGAATAFAAIVPLMLGTQISISQHQIQFPAKPVSLEGCADIYNVSAEFLKSMSPAPETLMPVGPTRGDVWLPLRISYLWYNVIALVCGLSAAVLTTLLISKADLKRVDSRLVAPISRRWLPKDGFDSHERGQHILIAEYTKAEKPEAKQ